MAFPSTTGTTATGFAGSAGQAQVGPHPLHELAHDGHSVFDAIVHTSSPQDMQVAGMV
jgi:hypothetical protein